MINYSTFLNELRATARMWQTDARGRIHSGGTNYRCPYVAVYDRLGSVWVVDMPAQSIWSAADNESGHDPLVRRDLLAACGIEEFVNA